MNDDTMDGADIETDGDGLLSVLPGRLGEVHQTPPPQKRQSRLFAANAAAELHRRGYAIIRLTPDDARLATN